MIVKMQTPPNFYRLFSRQLSKIDRDEVCQLISQLMQKGREMIMKALQQKPEYTTKSHLRDVVTKTDGDVERMLVAGIKDKFPDHKFIAEEGTTGTAKIPVISDAPTWIIDPIDGTMNFVHGFPHFCISIALYVEQRAEFAWIDNPLLRHSYVAQRGRGAYFNGQRMRVSGQRDLQQSLIYVNFRPGNRDTSTTESIYQLLPNVHGIRSMGSAVLNLCQVATGACDANLQFGAHVWDWAAAVLMIQEAGGVVMDPCGGDFDIYSRRMLAAATPELAAQIIPLISQQFPQPRDDDLNLD